jgi:Prp8 binding protein
MQAGRGPGAIVVAGGVKRVSSLTAPIMLATGHDGEVLACEFNADGSCFASAGSDRCVFLWRTHGNCPNYLVLKVCDGV